MDLTIHDLDLIPDLGSASAVTRPSLRLPFTSSERSRAPTPSGRAGPGIQVCLQVLSQPTENWFGLL